MTGQIKVLATPAKEQTLTLGNLGFVFSDSLTTGYDFVKIARGTPEEIVDALVYNINHRSDLFLCTAVEVADDTIELTTEEESITFSTDSNDLELTEFK